MTDINPIERNDVNLSRLFQWKTKTDIKDKNGEILLTAYIRLVGDADLNRARVYGIRSSKELRRLLKNNNSDEFLVYLPDMDDVEKGSAIESLVLYSMRDIASDSIRDVKIDEPKELPSLASLEEQEDHQEQIDDYPSKKKSSTEKYIDKRIKELRKDLESKSFEELYLILLDKMRNQICENRMVEKFREMCVYLGTFIDEDYSLHLFSSLEEFQNLPTDIKEQFTVAYNNLEMGIDELKN